MRRAFTLESAAQVAKLCALAKQKLAFSQCRADIPAMPENKSAPIFARARFAVGDVVRHRIFDFRGVVFDIDPVFANSEEWYQSIPEEIRPAKEQPFYHLFAENGESSYIAYVSEQNLLADGLGPVDHPGIPALFADWNGQRYPLKPEMRH